MTTATTKPKINVDSEGFMTLRMFAEIFTDMQNQRIALYNKLGVKADGSPTKERPNALVLDPSKYEALIQHSLFQEEQAQKILLATYREVAPQAVQDWQQQHKGIGEHSIAKVLGYAGHPRVAFPFVWEVDSNGKRKDTPTPLEPFERRVSDLWSYCGVGAPIHRTKGMTKEEALKLGNPNAKKALWLVAQGVIKGGAGDKYREVYDKTRAKYENAVHKLECPRCSPAGKPPAAVGTPMKLGHQHGIATRQIMKEILRDLWLVTPI